jgi:hypothetical protein
MTELPAAPLFGVARRSIEHGLAEDRPLPVEPAGFPPALREPGACFVTLQRGGALRGCIGSLEAARPLVVDVAENAFRAAFRDPRFPPLAALELVEVEIRLSVLGPLEPIAAASEAELVAGLRPGEHGVVLELAGRRATFLPAVWADLRDPRDFLRQLRRKAGIPDQGWPGGLRAWRYAVEELAPSPRGSA